MELNQEVQLPVSQAVAWQALNDMAVLKACIPGCESLLQTEVDTYELVILAAVGPVKARFKGKMNLLDVQAPAGYSIQFEGQGGVAGYGKGSADVRLDVQDEHNTLLRYTARASVGGKIAQIGARLVDMAAQKMASEFFGKFLKYLQGDLVIEAVAAADPAAGQADAGPPMADRPAVEVSQDADEDKPAKGWKRFIKR